jgi:hypothetical protein
MFSDPDITGTRESSIVKSGSYSGKEAITGSGWGGWGQWASVTEGQTLYATAPVNIPTALVNAEAVLEVKFVDSGEAQIGQAYTVTRNTSTSGWEDLCLAQVAPAGTAKASLSLLLRNNGTGSSGSVYFDDVVAGYSTRTGTGEPASFGLRLDRLARRFKKEEVTYNEVHGAGPAKISSPTIDDQCGAGPVLPGGRSR